MTTPLTTTQAAKLYGCTSRWWRTISTPDAITEMGHYRYLPSTVDRLKNEYKRGPMPRIPLDELKANFVRLVDNGNVDRTADELFVVAGTLRYRMDMLEKRVGKTLFYRPGFSRLTLDGRELYKELTNALD